MKNFNRENLALILGALCFILFASRPYLLDLIAPAKSIGAVIGENAKDLMEVMTNDSYEVNRPNSKREICLTSLQS